MADRPTLYQRFLPEGGQHSFVWKYSDPIGGRRPRHFHGEPEVNLVVRGSATFGVGDRIAEVSQGELLVFPSGQDHVLIQASPDLYLYAIGLDLPYSAQVLGVRNQPVVPLHVRIAPHELRGVLNRAASIVDRAGTAQLGAELWEHIHWLAGRAADQTRCRAHVLTRRSLQRMTESPELGLDALADELRAQASEISRNFHQDLGMTLVRYRSRQRLLHAIRLIDNAGHDLMAVASIAGFGSYSQFHRTFHAELGCSPRQFVSGVRKQMQLAYED
ncbi:MAG TPA: AraC family transcriptional regulator [Polyangiaceae bacterium]|nr:AraC family transcriptional regulator [Polyangiaceae bacterium]